MYLSRRLCSSLLLALTILSASSAPFDDFFDLRGSYCERERCCEGRIDSCSVPILGTLCYCDEFCFNTRVHDCCPDFWSFCKNITTPPPPPPPVTTDGYIEELKDGCPYNGRIIRRDEEINENCNKGVCKPVEGKRDLQIVFDTNAECLVDLNIIETINDAWGRHGWTSSNYSEFWGRTLDDGVVLRLGTLQPQKVVLKMNPLRRMYDPNLLPREFDSEQKWPGYILGIQDQGWCGSSWAISTAAVASDRYAIVSKGQEKVQLSAQNLLSCDINGQQSCDGGHLDRAWSFVRKFGLVDEECFPYIARKEKCYIKKRGSLLDSGCNTPFYNERVDRYTVGPAYRLGNETDIMHEITNSGPVQATMKVYQDFFSYKGGIYKHSDLALHKKQGYHSVRIVGWGEEGGQKYWKVANSWGPNWGENGYFRIAKGINECEIESFVLGTWPEVEEKILISALNEVY